MNSFVCQNRWLCRWNAENGRQKLRLFCFHHAGGGASLYRDWPRYSREFFEVIAVQLPGREHRIGEPAIIDMDELLDALVPVLVPELDRPYIFFGHSLGAILAFELCRIIQRRGLRAPEHLFVSSRSSPRIRAELEKVTRLPDDELAREIHQQYGGIPDAVFVNQDLLAFIIPSLRADMLLLQTHIYRPGPLLSYPLTAFTGSEDRFARGEEMQRWADETTGPFRCEIMHGGHFYLKDVPQILLTRMIAAVISGQRHASFLQPVCSI